MSKIKKMATLGVVATMSFNVVLTAGCFGGGGEEIDPNKTQLYIGLQESGFGRDWLDTLIADFELANPDIQVMEPSVKGDEYTSGQLLANIKYDSNDLYFINQMEYYDFVNRNGTSEYVADLTDIVTEGENTSIWARMYDASKEYFNVGTEDAPKVFAVPFVQSFWGLAYDKALFEEKGFYELDAYKGLDCQDDTADDLWGPDGKEGTTDDGLPATWEDMKALIGEMVSNEVTPFTWTGQYDDYRTKWLDSVVASYEGYEDFQLRYKMNGTTMLDTDGDGVEEEVTITPQNAYLLNNQEGLKAALTVAKYFVSDAAYYSTRAFNNTHSHTSAQFEFLSSKAQINGTKPIAFLLEGSWWEHEAKGSFSDLVADYGQEYAYKTRRFGFLPFPKFIGTNGIKDQTNEKSVISGSASTNSGAIFVNKNSKHLDVAKRFVKFFLQESNNAKFTSLTGLTQPYDYTMTDEQINNMSTYAQDLYNYSKSEDVSVISTFAGKN